MTATIMDEFQVLQRYHVLVLDREAAEAASYKIGGAYRKHHTVGRAFAGNTIQCGNGIYVPLIAPG